MYALHKLYTFWHIWRRFVCCSRCLLTIFLHRSSGGSLLRARCWLGRVGLRPLLIGCYLLNFLLLLSQSPGERKNLQRNFSSPFLFSPAQNGDGICICLDLPNGTEGERRGRREKREEGETAFRLKTEGGRRRRRGEKKI